MNVPQPLVRLWHRLGSPRWFYETTQPWLPWFGGAAALLPFVFRVCCFVWPLSPWGLGLHWVLLRPPPLSFP